MEKEELISKYVENKKAIDGLTKDNKDILKELTTFVEHKVGEIVKWTETGRRKRVGGSMWHPVYEDLPAKEHEAVLTKLSASIWVWTDNNPSLSYEYEFCPIKADGGVSKNRCYPNKDKIIWTGEIHKDYK